MKWIGGFLYTIAGCLILEVIKSFVAKQQYISSYLVGTVLICLQFFCLLGFVLFFLVSRVLKKYRVRRYCIVSIPIVLACFVLLDAGVYYLLKWPAAIPSAIKPSFAYFYDYYNTPLPQFDKKMAVYDRQLFYTLKPQARFRYANIEFDDQFQTNSIGVRDDEQSLQAPAIICLGDSYAMGWGVEQQETFAQQLEQLSGRKVLNAGVSSYGTAREMIMLGQLDTSALQCLVIQYCYNDLGENQSFIDSNYRLHVSEEGFYDSVAARQELLKKYFPGKYGLLMGQICLKRAINRVKPVFHLPFERENPFSGEKEHAAAFVKVLYHAPHIDFRKVKVLVTLLDSYNHMKSRFLDEVNALITQPPYAERFAGNLQVVNMAGLLSREDFYELDLHIRATGHKKVAEKIWQVMNEKRP